MWITCRVCRDEGRENTWKAHDSSNSRIMGLCEHHRKTERIRHGLPEIRGAARPLDDYNLMTLHKVDFSRTLTAA
jgi:hypothetical protein